MQDLSERFQKLDETCMDQRQALSKLREESQAMEKQLTDRNQEDRLKEMREAMKANADQYSQELRL